MLNNLPDWPGLKLSLNRSDPDNVIISGLICDDLETETIPNNSSSGHWNVGQVVNLFDGNFHNILWVWGSNDNTTYPVQDDGEQSIDVLQRGLLVVDGYIIGNQNQAWAGKATSLNFLYDLLGDSTFLGFGAEMTSTGSAISTPHFTDVTKSLNATIQRIVIWDRVLGGSNTLTDDDTNLYINSGFQVPNGSNSILTSTFLFGQNKGYSLYQPSYWDALTGTFYSSIANNVVAYYKFDEQNYLTDVNATDWAGLSNGGYQTNPAGGNTLNFYDTYYDYPNYLIYDSQNLDLTDEIYKTGILQFVDENNNVQKIGFINYDLGIMVFDNEYVTGGSNGFPILSQLTVSGMNMNRNSTNGFILREFAFTSQEFIERMVINLSITGEEMNNTQNPSGLDKTTKNQILKEPGGYATSVGLYNSSNELLGIAKFNKPIRKDTDHDIITQITLDF